MGILSGMIAPHVARFIRPAVATAWGFSASVLSASALPLASAQPCPDVEVVFARGTGEAPGLGPTGQAFADDLRSRVDGKSLDVYPVNYPASNDFATGVDGLYDESAHIVSTAQNCPNTKMVLGGYSQGAALMGYATSPVVPDGVDPVTVPKPLSPDVAKHVAAVVLFGTPNDRAMSFLGEPPVVIGPMYQSKTIKVCVPEDPVCSDGLNFAAHDTYADNATMVDQGAAFAAGRLGGNAGAPAPAGQVQESFGT